MTARIALALAALSVGGCGYQLAGRADLLPKNIHTIAVPAFRNVTIRYKLTDRLPAAIAREFLSRTRYAIVSNPEEADAVLYGTVTNYNAYPTVFDPATGRASAVQLSVILTVTLQQRGGAVLYQRQNMEFRERYEISADPRSYYDESDMALDRLSRDVARSVVSAVLEMF